MEVQATKKMRQIGIMCEAIRAFALAGVHARLTSGAYGLELSVFADTEEELTRYKQICSWFTSSDDKIEERYFPKGGETQEFYVYEVRKEYDEV